jgi:hypothetical protein
MASRQITVRLHFSAADRAAMLDSLRQVVAELRHKDGR